MPPSATEDVRGIKRFIRRSIHPSVCLSVCLSVWPMPKIHDTAQGSSFFRTEVITIIIIIDYNIVVREKLKKCESLVSRKKPNSVVI